MKLLPLSIIAVLCFAPAACTTLTTPTFTSDAGAIGGYDAVAYHLEMRPVQGDPAYAYRYNDATWYFASQQNLQRFRADPQRFAPQYGGYCAYGMSKGLVVSTDPQAWTIADGKLYLNYSEGVRNTWLKDVPSFVEKADRHWQGKVAKAESR
jgi:YHS domain-containing protein